ncbi:glycosyltransferase family 87 protein [Halosimplex amylolyticum]|uniref:glycosyltransferase family 87 protein n=1 Tax=Halosimplex amylolyticum TaxID=3396616 RepID=UPI003F572CA7
MSLIGRLWARRRERPTLVFVAALVLTALLAYPFVDWWLRANFEFASGFRFGDFGAYNAAVERWQRGESLYRRTEEGGFWGTYLYPPVVLLLFRPFTALLEFRPAAMAWVLSTALFLWVGLQALVAAMGYDLRWFERVGLAWLVAGFQPVILTAKLGQTSLFVGGLLSFAGAAMIWDGRRSADLTGESLLESPWALASGAATAVVGVVKFAYAPVGAHLLHDRRRMAGALLATVPVLWLSIRFFDVEAHRTYLEVLRWGVEKGSDDARSPTLWLAPYYKPLAWLPGAQMLRAVVCLGVAGLSVLAPPRARRSVFALGVAAVPLFAPQTYVYYFVALLPVAVVMLAVELERDGRPELVLVGLLLVHLHSYGLKFLVHNVPAAVPAFEALRPAYLLFQPGLWGNALLFGLAARSVVQSTDLTIDLLPILDGAENQTSEGDG